MNRCMAHGGGQLREVQNHMKDIMQVVKRKGPTTVEDLVQRIDLPFSTKVMSCPLPNKFTAP